MAKQTAKNVDFHNALNGGRYPYEMPQKRGTYFSILWYGVVRNYGPEFLETHGLFCNARLSKMVSVKTNKIKKQTAFLYINF